MRLTQSEPAELAEASSLRPARVQREWGRGIQSVDSVEVFAWFRIYRMRSDEEEKPGGYDHRAAVVDESAKNRHSLFLLPHCTNQMKV